MPVGDSSTSNRRRRNGAKIIGAKSPTARRREYLVICVIVETQCIASLRNECDFPTPHRHAQIKKTKALICAIRYIISKFFSEQVV